MNEESLQKAIFSGKHDVHLSKLEYNGQTRSMIITGVVFLPDGAEAKFNDCTIQFK